MAIPDASSLSSVNLSLRMQPARAIMANKFGPIEGTASSSELELGSKSFGMAVLPCASRFAATSHSESPLPSANGVCGGSN